MLCTISPSAPNGAAVSPQILAFSPDNWNVDQTINVRGLNDDILDGDLPYDVNIKTLFTTDPDYLREDLGYPAPRVTLVSLRKRGFLAADGTTFVILPPSAVATPHAT